MSGAENYLSVTGSSTIAGPLSNLGGLEFDGPVTLGNTVTMGASGRVDFASTIDGTIPGAEGLTVDTGGTAEFDGQVGGTAELLSLTVNGNTALDCPYIGLNGEADFNGPGYFDNTGTVPASGLVIQATTARFAGYFGPNGNAGIGIDGDAVFGGGVGLLQGGLVVSGDLTNTSGTFNGPPAGEDFWVGGDFSMAAGTFRDQGATLTMDGDDQGLSTGGAALSALEIESTGTVTAENALNIDGALTLDMGGTLDLHGNAVGAGSVSGPGALTDSGAAAALTVAPGSSDTFAGALTGTAGLTLGSGTLVLSGTSTNTGPTTVTSGTLEGDGTLSASPVSVASGATFDGSGTAASLTAASGATVTPGHPIGIMHVAGPVTLDSGSNLDIAINGTAAGTTYSQLSDTA
ncbi:MAG TPA: hypothetical protein VME22_08480, partial [Solirubrobacteraceae bacterium]|nr:hypothetical protein [Solirubrobacteraceae bacterium]